MTSDDVEDVAVPYVDCDGEVNVDSDDDDVILRCTSTMMEFGDRWYVISRCT
jgi:hypothetical protein